MYTKSDIIFMYAETGVHVGGGDSVGAIDLAIAREKYTDFPFIPSSGVKGAIRSFFDNSTKDKENIEVIFGPEINGSEHAGAAIFTDARILLFPVRSLKGVFTWITCPLVIERFNRDLRIANYSGESIKLPELNTGKVLVSSNNKNTLKDGSDKKVVLEEYTFDTTESDLKGITDLFEKAFPDSEEYKYWRDKIETNLIIMSDDDFRDFAKSSTEVQARIKINSETKTVDTGALFYQENLPADTLMYTVAASHRSFKKGDTQTANDIFDILKTNLDTKSLQLGGNESIGKGIFNLNFLSGKETEK